MIEREANPWARFNVGKDDDCFILDYGHITVKAPHPVRFEKLSTVELHQY